MKKENKYIKWTIAFSLLFALTFTVFGVLQPVDEIVQVANAYETDEDCFYYADAFERKYDNTFSCSCWDSDEYDKVVMHCINQEIYEEEKNSTITLTELMMLVDERGKVMVRIGNETVAKYGYMTKNTALKYVIYSTSHVS